jgi:phage shock protein PspC (stress-responsive transcriptional regulator)
MVAASTVPQADAMTTNDHDSTTGPAGPGPGGTTTTDGSAPAPVGHTSGWSDSGFDAESAKQTFTRPEGLRRSRTDRKVAGVCGGLGLQLGIDPTIVRVAMVVLTIAGGVGIPLYIILALLMPNEGADTTTVGNAVGPHLPEQVRSGPGLAILVVVLTLILGAVFGGAFNNQFWDHGGWPWPLIAAGVIGWLVYRKRKSGGTTAGADATRAAATAARPPAGYWAAVPADPADPGAPGPEFWSRPDPLGLYDPPAGVVAPAPVRAVVRTKRAPILMILTTLFLAAVSVACLGLFTAAGATVAPVLFAAVPALIVGAGLLIASRLGGSRLLVVAAVALGLTTAGVTQADLPSNLASGAWSRMGTSTVYAPATLAGAQAITSLPDGRNKLDLRGVDFGSGTTTLDLSLTDGAVEVILPENLDVSATLHVAPHGWGAVGADHNRFQSTAGGNSGKSLNTTDDGIDGANANGPHLNLDVAIDHGAVVLERSNS